MISYIFKFVVASLILFAVYYLFLRQEKTYRFNRFYLLFSILFSIVIPFITINIKSAPIPVHEPIFLSDNGIQSFYLPSTIQPTTDNNFWGVLFLGFYLSVSFFLLFRFLRNIFLVYFKVRNNEIISYRNAQLVLIHHKYNPHSFLKFIFINKDEFDTGAIEEEILTHELTHVKQKHSIDILFAELLLVFAWINPVLFLYRKAVALNHEFLADESVVSLSGQTQEYQYLLLSKSASCYKPALASTFNFLPIKKRIIMMNKNGSPKTEMIKKIVLIPVIILIGFFLTFKIVAQNVDPKSETSQPEVVKEGVSQKLLDEYQTITDSHKKLQNNGKIISPVRDFTQEEKERMEEIFTQMTKEQKLKQELGFMPLNRMYLKEVSLSNEKLELYKDSKMYGVWINSKRVKNDVLNNYKNTDFSQVNVSKLTKNAINYGKHYYQVNLMTNEYYRNYKNEVTSREGTMLVPIGMYIRAMKN